MTEEREKDPYGVNTISFGRSNPAEIEAIRLELEASKKRAERLEVALRKARHCVAAFPRSLGYHITLLPEIDEALSLEAGEK